MALQLGHRISEDVDFFTQEEFDERLVAMDLKRIPEFEKEKLAWRTVTGMVGKTKFSLFYYEYRLIDPRIEFEGIHLAGLRDIAAMKVHAIEDRGTKRDFVDLYFLVKGYFSVEEMLGFYNQKYRCLEDHLYQILKGLDYFVSADNEDMPEMLQAADWEELRGFFRQEARRLARLKLYPGS